MTFKMDPTVAFYLEHQKQIEEWARIKYKIGNQASEFFISLEEPLRDFGSSLRAKPQVTLIEPNKYDSSYYLLLYRTQWGDGNGNLSVGVGLTWFPDSTQFSEFQLDFQVLRGPNYNDKLSNWIWNKVPEDRPKQEPLLSLLPTDYWNHIDEFEKATLDRFKESWDYYRPMIDKYYNKRKK